MDPSAGIPMTCHSGHAAPMSDSEMLVYVHGGVTFRDRLALPKVAACDGRPAGVLVFPEWWGLNEFAVARACRLATLGFAALAVDLYGEGRVAADAAEAGLLKDRILADMGAAERRIRAALDAFATYADPQRIGAIGYCLGGALALHAARRGLPLRAVASFHGVLDSYHTPRRGEVGAEIAVFNGADDPLVSRESLVALEREMREAGAACEIVSYPGVRHTFTDPAADEWARRYGLPLGYDRAADEDSWRRAIELLTRTLQPG
jgi:dienelactone hydrolase